MNLLKMAEPLPLPAETPTRMTGWGLVRVGYGSHSVTPGLPVMNTTSRSYLSRFRIPTRCHSYFRALLLVYIKHHAFSSIFEYQNPFSISIARFQATEHISIQ